MTPTSHAKQQVEATVWPVWATQLTPKIGARQEALFCYFTEWMAMVAPEIWNGQKDFSIDKSVHEELRDKLIAKCPHPSANNEVSLVNWWDRLISAGNLAKLWQIPLLPSVIKLPSLSPTYVRRDFQLLAHFREIEEAVFSQFKTGLSENQLHPMIVVSAMVFGGVTSVPMICAIVNMNSSAIRGLDGELHVSLQLPYQLNNLIEQTWYPDAMTSVCIVRWMKSKSTVFVPSGLRDKTDLFKHIEGILAQMNLPAMASGDLLRAARVAFSLEVPPYIAAYLADDLQAQSLPLQVLQRLSGWDVTTANCDSPGLSEQGEKDRSARQMGFQNEFDPIENPLDQGTVISKVIKLLNTKSDAVTAIEVEVSSQRKQLWPMTYLLCMWIRWRKGAPLVKGDPSTGINAVVSSSSERYLRTVARHLIIEAGMQDPLEMEVDDLETLYELASARVKGSSERANFWGCIKSFHDFLVLHGAPEIVLEELDGFESGRRGAVAANLVGELEFCQFKTQLLPASTANPHSFATMVLLAAILGFRCGLRRREVQMILLSNVHLGSDPFLLVRASSLATLKSHSAHRRVPLKGLLLPDELKLLTNFCEARVLLFGDTPALLFSNPEAPAVPLPDRLLFDPITHAFQAILGPESPVFRFHHLRHSFANWLFLALLIADNPNLKSSSLFLKNAPLIADRLTVLKEEFFPRMLGAPNAPTRKNLYLVSYLCGHLSPATTTGWYLHLLDWLAGREADLALAPKLVKLTRDELARVCGLATSTLNTPTYRAVLEDKLQFLRKFVGRQMPGSQCEHPAEQKQLVNLDAIVGQIGNPQLPGPSTLMVILYHAARIKNSLKSGSDDEDKERFSAAAFASLENNHFVPRRVVMNLWDHYRALTGKQSRNEQDAVVPLPSPPRTLEDKSEFWRILDTTVASFKSEKSRPALIRAAELLIQRAGPSSGNLYFGKQQNLAPVAVRGLIAMGIGPLCLELEIRQPNDIDQKDPDVEAIANEVAALGVLKSRIQLTWEKRHGVRELLRLRVNKNIVGQPKPLNHLAGRIQGINYAAIWILFAEEMNTYYTSKLK